MKDTACRICGANNFKALLKDIKTELNETYSVLQCANCGFAFTHPLPSQKILNKYYQQNYWSNAGGAANPFVGILYNLRMRGIVREIKKALPEKAKILDWGAGDGALVRLLNSNGFDCYGIDLYSAPPDSEKIFNSSIENAPFEKASFDAITCFHVLEHIENPIEAIRKSSELLKPNGLLIIEVPNINSIGFKLFKKRWQPLEIPTHLNHFNIESFKTLFKITGSYEMIKAAYFSHRVSPSSIILSLLPFFSARRMRERFDGKYPFQFMGLYLLLQIAAYPFAYMESIIKKGSILRIWVIKRKSA